jgi:hypothetical protein
VVDLLRNEQVHRVDLVWRDVNHRLLRDGVVEELVGRELQLGILHVHHGVQPLDKALRRL